MKPKDTAYRCLRKQSTARGPGPASGPSEFFSDPQNCQKKCKYGPNIKFMQRNVRLDKTVKSITTVLFENSYFCVFSLRPYVIKRPSATR